jgi:hypothetical protein
VKNSFLTVSLIMLSACSAQAPKYACASANPEVCALYEQVEAIKRQQADEQQAFRGQQ